jgi:hypothetical protein
LNVKPTRTGLKPFRWEIHGTDTAEPLYLSPDAYAGMEAAFKAGEARLPEFILKRSAPPGRHQGSFLALPLVWPGLHDTRVVTRQRMEKLARRALTAS